MIEERIKQIISIYGLTAGGFADILGIQASGISHILSGRNKPSLDFVIRVLTKFPDIDWNWLVFGKGSMQRLEKTIAEEPSLFDNESITEVEEMKMDAVIKTQKEVVKQVEKPVPVEQTPISESKTKPDSRIRRIIVFYDNGTYEEVSN